MTEPDATVTLAHGNGGELTRELVAEFLQLPGFSSQRAPLEDQARLPLAALAAHGDRLAFTTDAYVVHPLEFPGGDIGTLAVCGTINDLAVGGARPLSLSCALILEEGLSFARLRRIAASMSATAETAGVPIVTGDTKVVERGACDGLFITTTGVGVVPPDLDLGIDRAQPGDVLLINGSLGDHGATVLAARGDLQLDAPLRSDCAPLHELTAALLHAAPHTRFIRDTTRGGLAQSLHDLARAADLGVEIDEPALPVHAPVRALTELLGLDPLYLANEGKLVCAVPPDEAPAALEALRAHPLGREAATIGRLTTAHPTRVVMTTVFGAPRLLAPLVNDQLPRIC